MPDMPAAIHVDREAGGYTDRARAYKVLVDGEERGTVKHAEGVEIEVEPGAHQLQMKLDWAGSPTLDVEIADGERAEFVCAPNATPLSAIFYALFRRSTYIRLERSAPSTPPSEPAAPGESSAS
jgi:hypothetical protein